MAYIIYKTNGQQLLTLLDGTLDSSRGVNLVGKNYVNFGTAQNENFVRLMENFANGTAPTYPLTGQLWYDTGTATLKYFDGTTFNILANAVGVTANVTALNSALIANVANLTSYFSSNVSALTANAAAQHAQIQNLWANAATQATSIGTLTGIITGSNIDLSGLLDGTNARIDSTDANVAAANVAIGAQSTAINGLTSSIDTINGTLAAHTVTQNNQTAAINAVQSGLDGANASILATNVAVRNYVDAQNLTQTNQINSLNSSVGVINSSITGFYTWANLNYGASDYSNSDVAQFLPTYTGDVAADNVIVGTGVFWANGNPYVANNYSNTNVATYLSGTVTVGNVKSTNGYFWANGTPYANSNYGNANVAAYITANPQAGTYANANVVAYLTTATINTSGNITAGNITATNLTNQFNSLQNGINGASAAITTANTAMKSYVDAGNTIQSNQINTINANIGSFYTYANATYSTIANAASQANDITTLQSQVNGPVFMANIATGQGIPTSPSTISQLSLIYDNVIKNVNSGYNATTGIFTAPTTGYYQVNASIGVTPSNWALVSSYNSGGVIGIYKNSNPVASGPYIDMRGLIIGNTVLQATTASSVSVMVYLSANDTLNCKLAYLTTAPNNFWNTSTNVIEGYFQAVWVRGA